MSGGLRHATGNGGQGGDWVSRIGCEIGSPQMEEDYGLIFDVEIEEISGNNESKEPNYCEILGMNSPTVQITAKQQHKGHKNAWSSFFQKKHALAKDKSTPSENKVIPKKCDN